MHNRIILASQSPRRKQLLDQLGLEYEILVSSIEEILPDSVGKGSSAAQVATELARKKAFSVGEELRKNGNNSADKVIIIAADTIVALDNRLFGKPNSAAEAKTILQ